MERLGIVVAGTRAEQEYIAQRQKHPATADAVARWCGRTPSDGWLFQESASPAVAAFGGENLTETGSPTWAAATPYPNQLAVSFTDGGATNVHASANTVFDDDGSTSFAFLMHWCGLGVAAPAASRGLMGKISGPWWLCIHTISNGYIQFYVYDGVTVKTAVVLAAHTNVDTWIWCSVDRTNNLIRCNTRLGSVSTDITGIGSLANVGVFNLGAGATLSPDGKLLAAYRFEGAEAEGDPTETMRRIQRYQGGF